MNNVFGHFTTWTSRNWDVFWTTGKRKTATQFGQCESPLCSVRSDAMMKQNNFVAKPRKKSGQCQRMNTA